MKIFEILKEGESESIDNSNPVGSLETKPGSKNRKLQKPHKEANKQHSPDDNDGGGKGEYENF
jgi:hypothetical protein